MARFVRGLRGQSALAMLLIAASLSGCGGGSDTSGSGPAGATAGNASAQSSADSVMLSTSQYQVPAPSTLVVTISRSGSAQGAGSVSYATSDGSAVVNADYAVSTGTVSWAQGDNSDKTVLISIAQRAAGKAFSISLSKPTGDVQLGTPATASIQIVAPPTAAASSGLTATAGSSATAGAARSVILSWLAPEENTDGSAITDLAGFNIYYGNSAKLLNHRISIQGVGHLTYVFEGLNTGHWYFAVTAVNALGIESRTSDPVGAAL